MHGLLVFLGSLVQSGEKKKTQICAMCAWFKAKVVYKSSAGKNVQWGEQGWVTWLLVVVSQWLILIVPISLGPEWQIHNKQPKAAGIKVLPESSQFLQGLSISVLIPARGMLWKCNPLPSFNLQPHASQLNWSTALTVCWNRTGADTETSALTGIA